VTEASHASSPAHLSFGKARAVRFSTLEAICEALQCQPGDLLEFTNTQEKEAI
jgi:putative transcriptional regulator